MLKFGLLVGRLILPRKISRLTRTVFQPPASSPTCVTGHRSSVISHQSLDMSWDTEFRRESAEARRV